MTRGEIAVEGLSLRLGGFALREVNLAVGTGEILVLLGPNGAGKSVTLETIAGFHRPRAGRVTIGGRDVTRLPPEHRHVGLVFQNFGLFPHLSVARNVAMGLRARRARAAGDPAATRDVPEWLAYFGIAHLADRNPQALSAGEKQRVSLARAFANRPDLFLFDEPFSALDALTRDQLRQDLGRFLRSSTVPAIFVTHDQSDARALADLVAVMKEGVVVQSGTTEAVFHRPASRFVAEFVGVENVLPGRVEERSSGWLRVAAGPCRFLVEDRAATAGKAEVALCIRAEEVRLRAVERDRPDPAPGLNRLAARIVAMSNLGALTKVVVDGGIELAAYIMSREIQGSGLVPGAAVEAEIAAAAIHLAAWS